MVVVGASTGGVAALSILVSTLPAHFDAPVLVVQHTGPNPSILPEILASRGALPVAHARDGEPLESGRIYVAPPDHHMLVENDRIRLTRGPKEHFTRPAIDPLFLSAALAGGPGVIGVILTGALDDGTAGLQAIKACGGKALVQDPDEAQSPDMPRSALAFVDVDHCRPLAEMAEVLQAFIDEAPALSASVVLPSDLVHEQELAVATGDPMELLAAIAQPSTFVCPDCNGSLWQLNDSKPIRYRCHTGHAYTSKTLQSTLAATTDQALWAAIRALQEQAILLRSLAAVHRGAGDVEHARQLEATEQALAAQARSLRCLAEKQPDTFP